jgi:hypothetical protein
VIALQPVTRADVGVLTSAAAGIIGARLSAVIYHYLPPADGPGYAGGGDGVDADVAAVVLDLGDRGRRTITWAMQGELEGISILGQEVSYSGLADKTVDASSREAWRDHIGDTITSIAAAWQVSGDGCPESLWAMRLDFSAGSVVVALGTADHDIEYMPDELVVVFDTTLAGAYRPRHVSESAWGQRIAPT